MKSYAGLGPDTLVPRLVAAALPQLKVGAEEGFVLSRVDGHTTVAEICLLVPFDAEVTVGILKRLRAAGALDVPGAAPRPRPAAAVSSATLPALELDEDTPTPIQTTLVSRLAHTPPTTTSPHRVVLPSLEPTPPATPVLPSPPPPLKLDPDAATPIYSRAIHRTPLPDPTQPTVPVVADVPAAPAPAAAPAKMVDGLELTVDQAARIDEFFANLERRDAFELLEVTRAADKRAIKRAYFKLSKEFHPDRFFGKNIGSYRERLSRIFQAVKAAFELLSDDNRRAAYEQSAVRK